jgi:hypothetical protein
MQNPYINYAATAIINHMDIACISQFEPLQRDILNR